MFPSSYPLLQAGTASDLVSRGSTSPGVDSPRTVLRVRAVEGRLRVRRDGLSRSKRRERGPRWPKIGYFDIGDEGSSLGVR